MPGKRSAGILLFRHVGGTIEVLLGHMGGPFWAKRDAGGWSVPKGEHKPDEEPEAAARREFQEELGLPVPSGELVDLGAVRQSGGKDVTVWAVESDLDPALVVPGTFEMEWPKGSGRIQEFPEIDRVAWFDLEQAREKIVAGQRIFLDRLAHACRGRWRPEKGMDVADLQDFAKLVRQDRGLAGVAIARPDGSVHASVVNVGVLDHPVSGTPVVGFVTLSRARKLVLLRAGSSLAVTLRAGWEWVTVEGTADLAGPDDPLDGFAPERLPRLLRDVFTAAGGTHENWAEYDRVMAAERRTAVLILPRRIYSNPR